MQDSLPAFVLHSNATMRGDSEQISEPPDNSAEPCSQWSDERLMFAFCHGGADAFAELFSRYKQPLYGFFRRRLDDAIHAEELTQETFVAIIRAASRYEPRALFRTYLYAVAFKILRAHRRKTFFRATFFSGFRNDQEPAARENLDTQMYLREAIDRLQPLNREILMLREFEQLSYAEIAELLSLPVGTVRSRLCRARVALHETLAASAPLSSTKDRSASEESL